MKTPQHTPGPWIVRGGNVIESLSSINVAKAWMTDGEEECANAHLIAAAPELLSALEAIEARINGVYDCPALVAFGPLHHDTQWDCLRIAEEAIAKAKGERIK